MHGQYQEQAAVDASGETQIPDRFTALLVDIRNGLGSHWACYVECVEGVLRAATQQQDASAWFEQMQLVIQGIEKVQISHEGLLFLLQDMGIHQPKQQSWGAERETRKSDSPLSPKETFSNTPPSSFADVGLCHPQPLTIMSAILSQEPLGSDIPIMAGLPPPRASTPRSQQPQSQSQSQQKEQSDAFSEGDLPFDFSTPMRLQPKLTFSKNLRAYFCPADVIILSKDYVPPPPDPLRRTSNNPVFFTDPALRADVAEVFGYAVQRKSNAPLGNMGIQTPPQTLSYDARVDDLVVWNSHLKAGKSGGEDEVKANGFATDTWPIWNFRFDLDV